MEQDCSVTEGEVWTEDAAIIYTGPEKEADLTWDRCLLYTSDAADD